MLLAWSRKTRPQAGLPDLGTPEIECKVWCDALFWGSIGNLLFRFVIGRYKSGTICYLYSILLLILSTLTVEPRTAKNGTWV